MFTREAGILPAKKVTRISHVDHPIESHGSFLERCNGDVAVKHHWQTLLVLDGDWLPLSGSGTQPENMEMT